MDESFVAIAQDMILSTPPPRIINLKLIQPPHQPTILLLTRESLYKDLHDWYLIVAVVDNSNPADSPL